MTDDPSFPESFGTVTSLTLINLAKSADRAAWETLFRLYSPLVRYWLRKSRIPQLDEDDLVQEVFRSIHSGLARFEKKSATSPTQFDLRLRSDHDSTQRIEIPWRAIAGEQD